MEIFINSRGSIYFVLTLNGCLHACRNSDEDPMCVHVFRVDLFVYTHAMEARGQGQVTSSLLSTLFSVSH